MPCLACCAMTSRPQAVPRSCWTCCPTGQQQSAWPQRWPTRGGAFIVQPPQEPPGAGGIKLALLYELLTKEQMHDVRMLAQSIKALP